MMKNLKQNIYTKIKEIVHFFVWIILRFDQDNGSLRAAALTFTTLLTLVPFLLVFISIMSLFPVYQHLYTTIQNFILENFVPHTGSVIGPYLSKFEQQLSHLGAIEIISLLITVTLTMFTIESTINAIWHTPKRRHVLLSLVFYWGAIMTGPILLVLSVIISSTLYAWSLGIGLHIPETPFMLSMLPYLVNFVAFLLLYLIVPHCKVRFKNAAYGALFASILFEVAKNVFVFYLGHIHTYTVLYGTVAFIPLFILWLYFSWVIFLLGAQVVNALRHQQAKRHHRHIDPFLLAFRVMVHLFERAQNKQSTSVEYILSRERDCAFNSLQKVLLELEEQDIIAHVKTEEYILLANLKTLSIDDWIEKMRYFVPQTIAPLQTSDPYNARLEQYLSHLHQHKESSLSFLAILENQSN